MKDVGKPCDREGHARIDGGELETGHAVARDTGSGRPRETPGISAGPTATTLLPRQLPTLHSCSGTRMSIVVVMAADHAREQGEQ